MDDIILDNNENFKITNVDGKKCIYNKSKIEENDYCIEISNNNKRVFLSFEGAEDLIDTLIMDLCKNKDVRKGYDMSLPEENYEVKDSDFKKTNSINNTSKLKISLSNKNETCPVCNELVITGKKCLVLDSHRIHHNCISEFINKINISEEDKSQITIKKI